MSDCKSHNWFFKAGEIVRCYNCKIPFHEEEQMCALSAYKEELVKKLEELSWPLECEHYAGEVVNVNSVLEIINKYK